MTPLLWALLGLGAVGFSAVERRLWGSARTPFAFVSYPLLAMLAVALTVGPVMGFIPLAVGSVGVHSIVLVVMALASLAARALDGGRLRDSPLESFAARLDAGEQERGISAGEYAAVTVLIAVAFWNDLTGGAVGVEKGELGVGSIRTHLLPLGMAYLLLALSQRRGASVMRLLLAGVVLWVLAVNQVKYLIFLPLAGALLYRWVSRQFSTARVLAVSAVLPLGIVLSVYAFFGVAAATGGIPITWSVVLELGAHMVSYLVSGVIGLDQFLNEGRTVALGVEGLRYALAPIENLARFAVGAGGYFSVVNQIYLPVTTDARLDSNVFTMFGSLLLRAGWIGAVTITTVYGLVSYWIWRNWRRASTPVLCAPGSWWMAPLLFTWFDPLFVQLTLIEVMVILWLRAKVH